MQNREVGDTSNTPSNPNSNIKQMTTASTSNTYQKKRTNKKSKPSVLSLEQLIVEKLKLESNPKKDLINTSDRSDRNSKKSRKPQTSCVPHNSLDSSAPTRKRGKEREIPKPKKPTTLKKIIINEKSERISKTDHNLAPTLSLEELNKRLLHNKSYRDYCEQRLSLKVDHLVVALLSDLVLFQDRMYSKDPIKAQVKRRLCFGFNEVKKYTKINKTKLLVIAPDIEKIESKGGLNDHLSTLITISQINGIPIVFALNRRLLGIVCKKKGCVSCVAVLNYDGSQENFKQLLSLSEMQRFEYKSLFEESLNQLKALPEEEVQLIIDGLPNIPKHFSEFCRQLNPSERRGIKF